MARELTGDGLAVECLNCGEAHEQDGTFCGECQEAHPLAHVEQQQESSSHEVYDATQEGEL